MDILIIDRDSLSGQLLTSRLEAKGHKVTAHPNKNEAFELIKNNSYDCILFDPAPLSEAKPVVFSIRKSLGNRELKPFLLLLSKTADSQEAVTNGANDVLTKPLNNQELDTKIRNAERLTEITRLLAHEDNIHSAGGMIGKAAFNQLFLSATDRAFRYAERSLIVFVNITNFNELLATAPKEKMAELMEKLIERMTFMRRQSDVIGRLGMSDFAIILQRPQFESEPIDAINRFTEQLEKFHEKMKSEGVAPVIRMRLIELPQGTEIATRSVPQTEHSSALSGQP